MPSRRIARARQPQTLVPINRANKFGARTQFFSSDLGQLIDAATGRIPTISGVVPAMDFAGVVREIDTAGASPHYVEWPSAGVDLSGPFTIAIKIRRLVASSSQYDRIFHSEGTTGGGSRFGFLFTGSGDGNGPDKVYFDFVDSVGGSGAVYPPVTPTSSTTNYETYVATHDGANVRIYLNGVLQGSVAFTTFAAAQLPNPIRYGADTFAGGGTNNGAPARIQFAHIMRGALTAAEVFAYSANPWQIFTPTRRRVSVQVSAGGGPVSVAITGVSGTGAVGSLAPAVSAALTGNAGTGVVGSVAPSASIALTGNAGTGVVGSAAPSVTVALTGVSGTGVVGALTPVSGVVIALTGVSGTGVVGSLAPAVSVALTGVSGTGVVGSLGIASSLATVTPGRVLYTPSQVRGESDEAKRARRIREGTIAPDPVDEPVTAKAVEPDTELDAQAAKLRAARLRIQEDSARLQARIDVAEAKQQRTAAAERNLMRARQALQLKAAEEAFVVEQLEVMDVAFVAMTVIRLAAGLSAIN